MSQKQNIGVFLKQEDKAEAEELLKYLKSNDAFGQVLIKTYLDAFNTGFSAGMMSAKKPA